MPTAGERPRGAVGAMWRTPQVARLFTASLVARLPFAVVTVLLVLRLRELGVSYGEAGAVVACYAFGTGLSEPFVARWIDRAGQTVVLRWTVPVNVAAFEAIAFAPPGTPVAAVAAAACLVGVSYPQVGGMLRALLTELLPEGERRHAAFGVEANAVELLFIVGPVVFVAGLADHAGAATGLGVAGVITGVGATAFGLLPASRSWRPHPPPAMGAAPVRLLSPRYVGLLGVLLALGLAFGAFEIAATAFAEDQGNRARVGLLLALNAAGSLTGGIVALRAGVPADLSRRLAALLAVQVGCFLLLALPRSLTAMAPAMFVAGMAFAPSMATTYGIVADAVPPARLTEGYGWIGFALMGGVSLGGLAGGAIAGATSPSTIFLVAAAPLALAAALTARRGAARKVNVGSPPG